MTTSEATVSAGFANGLLEFAVSRGALRSALLVRSGLAESALRDPDARVSFSRYVALMRAAKELTGDAALALRFGEEIECHNVSIVGHVGRAAPAPTMAEGLAQLNRFSPLLSDVDRAADERFQLVRDKSHWIVDTRRNPNDFPELTETSFARIVCGMRQRHPDIPFAKAIHLTFANPGYPAEYERIFRVPVTFDSDRNAIMVERDWETRRGADPQPYVGEIIKAHAETLLSRLADSKTTRGCVEARLAPALARGCAGMDMIAAELGLGRRTLARKLKAEGLTYEQVLEDLRRRLALHHLEAGKASINETSYLLGFADPAAFSRAFKRWTGVSPSAVRMRKPTRSAAAE